MHMFASILDILDDGFSNLARGLFLATDFIGIEEE